MQALNDIWSSIKGNATTRVKDPVIGAFIVSWCFCNWDKLAALFWGTKKIDERIQDMANSMSISNSLSDLGLLVFPLLLSVAYLFLLPGLSLWVKKKQDNTVLSQHSHAVELDIKRAVEQRELNKAALRADPEKEFLAEEVKIDLQREKDRVERRNKIREYIEQKTKAAKADADTKLAQAEKERISLESKNRKEEVDKHRFESQSAIHRSTLASNRFPAAYQLMSFISQSLSEDNITLSLEGLSSTAAASFGYASGKEMMDDEKFNNESLSNIKYLYQDYSFLAKRLDEIAKNEHSDNEYLSGELLFDHLLGVLENYPFEFLSDESLAEKIGEEVNEHGYDIIGSEELSGPMAETDTVFEEIELSIDDYDFNNGFEVSMSGYASGSHRKESGVRGQDLSVKVIATCVPAVGRFGLSAHELQISGSPDYGDEEAFSGQ
ncbi:MAG: hypothetical protein V7752_13320 [Halopseudomonas sp.]